MYEDLVKRLRIDQRLAEIAAEDVAKMPNTIFGEAADAIEELQKLTDAQLDIIKQYQGYLTKPRAYDRDQYDRGYHDGRMFRPAIVTNADRIRAMTDEELANYLYELTICGCPDHGARDCVPSYEACWLDWLKQEATDGT